MIKKCHKREYIWPYFCRLWKINEINNFFSEKVWISRGIWFVTFWGWQPGNKLFHAPFKRTYFQEPFSISCTTWYGVYSCSKKCQFLKLHNLLQIEFRARAFYRALKVYGNLINPKIFNSHGRGVSKFALFRNCINLKGIGTVKTWAMILP